MPRPSSPRPVSRGPPASSGTTPGRGTGRSRKRPSLYARNPGRSVELEEFMPQLMAVVAPHAEALESTANPLAVLLRERLRQSIVRLAPLLEESMSQLDALQAATCQVAASNADLRDSLADAHGVLSTSSQRLKRLRPMSHELTPALLKRLPRWQQELDAMGSPEASQIRRRLDANVRALLTAKHAELRARLFLDDAHAVLRQALMELLKVARDCEAAFPDVARRVVPRPIEPVEETDPYQIH